MFIKRKSTAFAVAVLLATALLAWFVFSPVTARVNAATGETGEKTEENNPFAKTTLKLILVEIGTGKTLSGATFGIYEAGSGRKADEITTGESGIAYSLKLSDGAYYLVEQRTPDGYKFNAAEVYFNMKFKETKEITVTNVPEEPEKPAAANSYIRLITRAEDTEAILSGAVFGIYYMETDEIVAELTTGVDGAAKSQALPAGDYYLLELIAPVGYKLKDDKINLSLNARETKELTVLNAPKDAEAHMTGILNLTVKAETTGVRLSGAVFGVFDAATNDRITEIDTGTDGLAVCELPVGNYYLFELEAPAGFTVELAWLPFIINADTAVKVDVTNAAERGGVRVINRSLTGERVENAVFGIFNASTGARVSEIVTGEDGTALCVLPSGVYYAAQEQAPTDYIINGEKHSFFVSSGQTVDVWVYNRRDVTAAQSNNGAPMTGKPFPYRNYALLVTIAAVCGFMLFRRNKRNHAR